MNQEIVTNLQRVYNRLRIIAVTLKSNALDETDMPEIGGMIEDLLVEDFQPSIDAIKQAEG